MTFVEKGKKCLERKVALLWSFRVGRDEKGKEKMKVESRHKSTHEVVRHVWALWKRLR